MTFILIVLQALYFVAPAGIANIFPVLFKNIGPSTPISEKYFGKNKTWRGFFAGIVGASVVLLIQRLLYNKGIVLDWALVDYNSISLLSYAFLFGVGALLGDLLASYFKRKLGIPPGKARFPIDQIDWVVGSIFLISILYQLSRMHILAAIVGLGIIHILFNFFGFYLGLKDSRW